jgi:hypothetical protein
MQLPQICGQNLTVENMASIRSGQRFVLQQRTWLSVLNSLFNVAVAAASLLGGIDCFLTTRALLGKRLSHIVLAAQRFY